MQKLCFYFLLQLWVPLRYRCSTLDLCDTGALPIKLTSQLGAGPRIAEVKGSNPVQAWVFSRFLFATAKVTYITTMTFLHIILHSAVHIYDFHIFITSSSSFHEFITNQFNDLLTVGLLAYFVDRCTGIAEVKVRIPYKPEYFSGFLFATAKLAYITGMIFLHITQSYHALRRFSAYILKRQKRTVLSFVTFVPSTVWVHRCAMRQIFSLIMVIKFVQEWLCVSECIVDNRATRLV